MAEDLNSVDQEQIQQVARAELKPGIAGLRVQRTDHSATLPPPQSFRLVKLLLSYSKHISINDFYLLVVIIVKKLPHSLPSHLVAMFSHSPTPRPPRPPAPI